MPVSRYSQTNTFFNGSENISQKAAKKDLRAIKQYETFQLRYPSPNEMRELEYKTQYWRINDKLYNLAYEYYGNPEMWWVIAWYNQKPGDFMFKQGDVVYIPFPLSSVLAYFGL